MPNQATDSPFRSLIRTFGLLKRVMEPYFARFGISGSQWGILRALHRAEEEGQRELRLTDLSDRLLIRPPSVTGVIDRLQRAGFVVRVASADDQRVKLASLTPAGRRLVRGVIKAHAAQVRAVLGGLSARDQRELGRLLERLGAHLSGMASKNGDAFAATVAEHSDRRDRNNP